MRALVFGATGQDGSYVAELLLQKGYDVHGTHRRSSSPNFQRIAHVLDRLTLHHCDLTDAVSVRNVVSTVQPDEIYNEADMDHVGWSFDTPFYSLDVTAAGPMRIFEAALAYAPGARIFQPCSSHMFGLVDTQPQTEETPFNPVSPYGCAKVYAYHTASYYRSRYGMSICCGILYNHESPRRSTEYVTRKITSHAARGEKVRLGNINAHIDWGYAGDYMDAAWRMLQQPTADDYVIATGATHTVADILEICYGPNWRDMYEVDGELLRPTDTGVLVGDASKARRTLDWSPTVGFRHLIEMMVEHDRAYQ